jgi:hypothetical protein
VRFARLVLAASSLPFLAIGVGFLLAPGPMAANVDVTLASATAASDVRAVYGGLQIAIGALLAACAFSAAHLRAGLILQIATFAGLASGRLVSLPLDGALSSLGAALLAAEIAGLALGVVALVYLPSSRSFHTENSAG